MTDEKDEIIEELSFQLDSLRVRFDAQTEVARALRCKNRQLYVLLEEANKAIAYAECEAMSLVKQLEEVEGEFERIEVQNRERYALAE